MSKITCEYVTKKPIGNGKYFTGQIRYVDGRVTSQQGTVYYSDGARAYCDYYTQDFQVPYGKYYLWIDKDNTKVSQYRADQGKNTLTQTWDVKGRAYYILGAKSGPCFNTNSSGSNSGGSSYSGGSSNSTQSTSSSHTATCRGCNGSGKCGHCGGTGLKNSGTLNGGVYKCPLCHGTGRCQSCAGTGKKHY